MCLLRRIAVVVAVVLAAFLACSCGANTEPPADAPTAVALVQSRRGSELVVVDLRRFEVRRRVRLRSLCLSIDGDRRARTVVSAQCGGPDRAADSACGVWRLSVRERVGYVELGVPNPSFVAVDAGRAFVLHGFEQTEGLCTSVVGVGAESVAETGHAPVLAGRPERLGNNIVVPVAASMASESPEPASLLAVAGPSAGSKLLEFAGATAVTALSPGRSPENVAYAVTASDSIGRPGDAPYRWRIHRLEEAGERWVEVLSNDLPDVENGVHVVAATQGEVFVADSDGIDLAQPGRTTRVLDARTLKETRRIEFEGMPAALAAWGDRLVAFDGLTGELLLFEPRTSVPARRLDLGAIPLGTGDLVIFED